MQDIIRNWRIRFPEDEIHVTTTREGAALIGADLDLNRLIIHKVRVPQHGLSNLLEVPLIAKRISANVVIAQNFTPLITKNVFTFLHDAMFETNPEWFTHLERVYFRALRFALRFSKGIFTSSETEANRIRTTFNLKSPITAVGLGISQELSRANSLKPDLDVQPYKFSMIVGRLNIRKNLAYGLDSLYRAGLISSDCPMVVVGEQQGRWETLPVHLQALHQSGAVLMVGKIDDANLGWLYENCQFVAFPTLDEGFGLPVIEARHYGAPLVLSDIPVLREVAGTHPATFFPLDDLAGAAVALGGVAPRSSPSGDSLSRTSLQQQYNWHRIVHCMRKSIQLHDDEVNGRGSNWNS